MGKILIQFCSIKGNGDRWFLKLRENSSRVYMRVCIVKINEKRMAKGTYICIHKDEVQLGYLPSCPPWVTQRDERGATCEFTVLPLIHKQCISGATWDLD